MVDHGFKPRSCQSKTIKLIFAGLRRSSLVECVSVLHGTCLQSVDFFFIRQYVQPCLSKNRKYTFYTIKSSLTLAY